MPVCWKSPNHIDPTDTLLAFLMVVLVGAKRFAHAGLLRSDQALHVLLGVKRFPTDDTIRNLFRKFGMGQVQRFFAPPPPDDAGLASIAPRQPGQLSVFDSINPSGGIIDRLELDADGGLIVTDYKTGKVPSESQEMARLGGVHQPERRALHRGSGLEHA